MARVPLQQTPQVGIDTGSAPQFTGGQIQPVQDVVTDDIQRFGQAQMDVAKVAFKIQDQINDTNTTKLHNEFLDEVNKIELDYLSLTGGDAVATIDKDENDNPITAFDQSTIKINELLENIASKADNAEIKFMFENKAASSSRVAIESMTKHSIVQSKKYQNAEIEANITKLSREASGDWKNYKDPESKWAINTAAAIAQANNFADLNGMLANSSQRANLINATYNTIHKDTLDSMITAESFVVAQTYLNDVIGSGTINPLIAKQYQKIINTGYTQTTGTEIGDSIFDNIGDITSGDRTTVLNFLNTLESNNVANDGTGGFVKNGVHFNENNELIDYTKEDSFQSIETESFESKFYNADTNSFTFAQENLPLYMMLVTKIGVKKADSIFTKAKTNAGGKDANNEDIVNNIVILSKEALLKKYTNENYLNLVNSDIDFIASKINNPQYTINSETGLPLQSELIAHAKATIQNKDKLKYAINQIKARYTEAETGITENYNELKRQATEIAYATPNGWKNISPQIWEQLKEEDKRALEKGYSKTDNQEYLYELAVNPSLIEGLDENRHLLTEKTYFKLKKEQEGLNTETEIIAATGDVTMLQNTLNKYDMGDLHTSNNKTKQAKYVAIHEAWKNEINAQQITLKRKLTRAEKQTALNTVLIDNVNIDNDPFLGFIGGDDTIDKNIFFVDQDRLQDVYVDVPYNGENVRIFTSKIDPFVMEAIKESLRKAGKPVTSKNIADYFVRKGQPATLDEAFAYKEEE